MDTIQKTLLALIRKSQFGTSADVDWDCVDLDALFDEAMAQSVIGLISPEIPSDILGKRFQEEIYRGKAAYIRYCHAEDGLKMVLDKETVPFVILKGNAAAVYYKDPSRRSMGDIDFLVPQDKYNLARQILIDNDFKVIDESPTYTRHIGLMKEGVHFELHHHFSHDDLDIESYLVEGLGNRVINVCDGHEFPMLPKLINGIVLLEHLRAHLKTSLGLRQIIDWMMYVYRELDDEFWESEFASVCREIGIDKLAITATRMCQLYLGLPETITWCKSADVKTCELLIDSLLISGNFGRKNGDGHSVEKVSTYIKSKGLFPWLQHAGEHNWQAYHKHHWLKPFCWLYQIFRYAKQGIKTGRNNKQLKSDIDRSKDRYELLKRLGID